ncbi:MAG: hypothetical protein QOF51_3141, partial [Chloroflexota bacterium]|nr:hypothetical protein [Chloroflexota bacterium]
MLQVDLPTSGEAVNNGDTIDIGGWTDGARVDVYLDGPAGVGTGIGTTMVDGARPDVARVTGHADLANSGFDLYWDPTDLSAGPHTLYVYSLVNGSWIMQTAGFYSAGNMLPEPERGADNESNMVGS